MTASAPRLDPRLVERLEQLERSELSFAEIRRTLVVRAREFDVPPPSYEHVRRLVTRRRIEREVTAEVRALALGVAVGTRHPADLLVALRSGDSKI